MKTEELDIVASLKLCTLRPPLPFLKIHLASVMKC